MKAKRSLGQNFLNDPKTLKTIVDQGNIKPNDIILEIGPGTGNLSDYIRRGTHRTGTRVVF